MTPDRTQPQGEVEFSPNAPRGSISSSEATAGGRCNRHEFHLAQIVSLGNATRRLLRNSLPNLAHRAGD